MQESGLTAVGVLFGMVILLAMAALGLRVRQLRIGEAHARRLIDDYIAEIRVLEQRLAASENANLEIQGKLSDCNELCNAFKNRIQRFDYLRKYEHIETLRVLDDEVTRLTERASSLRATEREYQTKINEHIKSANLRASEIIKEAQGRAEQIAGDAVEVARDYRRYEQAIKAMKNIIEGYGNKYIIPGQSLIDELAEVYGHTEAGKELKRARARVRKMTEDGLAASCDYSEPSRRATAIQFVLDAFNGKVDTILSCVRRDNYGSLKQRILDAYTIVNLHGQAFRNACIRDEYLSARLDELKWASAAQEVRAQAQEEQKRIKERMRDEERARREYQKAIKETKREEVSLRKAMEEAQQKLLSATAAQKAAYEEKLRDLEEKLRIAEEKNQRALSMAQQTKSGYVYIISNIGSFGEHVFKIGMTRRLEPLDRVKELGDASVPFNFDVHALIQSDDAPTLENQLHKRFVLDRVNKVNHRREFFRTDLSAVKSEIEKLGLDCQWTLLAEARQYYETLAIEKKLAEDPEARELWIRNQYALETQELYADEEEGRIEDDED